MSHSATARVRPSARPPHTLEDDDVGLACLNSGLVVRQANERFSRCLGGASAEVGGHRLLDLVHPEARPGLTRRLSRLLNGADHRFTVRIRPARQLAAQAPVTLTAFAVRGVPLDMSAILVVPSPADAPARAADAAPRAEGCLTAVDARILEGLAAGHSTAHLASRLHFSRQSIDYHVTCLLRRFQVPNRTALVSRAFTAGLFHPGTWPPQIVEGAVM